MLSKEYAMYKTTYIGIAPFLAAKTRALFNTEPEDKVAMSK
jgi:hypothetical protein